MNKSNVKTRLEKVSARNVAAPPTSSFLLSFSSLNIPSHFFHSSSLKMKCHDYLKAMEIVRIEIERIRPVSG